MGSPRVTTPSSEMTLGCENWPMIAASLRNFTRLSSEAPGCRILMATSCWPMGHCHTRAKVFLGPEKYIFRNVRTISCGCIHCGISREVTHTQLASIIYLALYRNKHLLRARCPMGVIPTHLFPLLCHTQQHNTTVTCDLKHCLTVSGSSVFDFWTAAHRALPGWRQAPSRCHSQ